MLSIALAKFREMVYRENNIYNSLLTLNKDRQITKFNEVAPKFILRLNKGGDLMWKTVELNEDSRKYIHIFLRNTKRRFDENGKQVFYESKKYPMTKCTEDDF